MLVYQRVNLIECSIAMFDYPRVEGPNDLLYENSRSVGNQIFFLILLLAFCIFLNPSHFEVPTLVKKRASQMRTLMDDDNGR